MEALNPSILKPYLDAILSERDWSWSFVSILYLLSAMIIRSWFIGDIASRIGSLDSKARKSVKKSYLKRSLPGWLFFFLPVGAIFTLWQNLPLPARPVRIEQWHLVIAALGSYFFSILLHLRAFAAAALQTLKHFGETEQQKKFLEG